MSEQILLCDIDARGVARVIMNRPEIGNAFNAALIAEITDAVIELDVDPSVRAIALTGAGVVFSAGADLNMMREAGSNTFAQNKAEADRLAAMLHAIYASHKPTIALVNGPAVGGGLGLISACNVALGVDTAHFAFSEARLGIIPSAISPFVIRTIGPRQAERYFLTGERFSAQKAVDIGLLHLCAQNDELDNAFDTLLKSMLACGPEAQREAKILVRSIAGRFIDHALLDETAKRIATIRASEEGQEGLSAFLEKRKPNWVTAANV